jgi:guanine deaminase
MHDWTLRRKRWTGKFFALAREVAAPIAKRKIPMKRLLGREVLAAFKEWASKADKVRY